MKSVQRLPHLSRPLTHAPPALQMVDLPTEVVTMLAFLEDMVTMSKVCAGPPVVRSVAAVGGWRLTAGFFFAAAPTEIEADGGGARAAVPAGRVPQARLGLDGGCGLCVCGEGRRGIGRSRSLCVFFWCLCDAT